jgi:hypothetical protein
MTLWRCRELHAMMASRPCTRLRANELSGPWTVLPSEPSVRRAKEEERCDGATEKAVTEDR